MDNELEILKKLFHRTLPEPELVDLYFQYRDKYRVLLSLLQQPAFPAKYALNIIPRLYPMDLVKVIKNRRTRASIRQRTEMEFMNKYDRFPLGEKVSYLKISPISLLNYFTEEQDPHLLPVILENPFCTEELILKFINRKTERFTFYEALAESEWYKRPQVALGVSFDKTAPIKIMLKVIPFLHLKQLDKLYNDSQTHRIIKENIILYLQERNAGNSFI